MNIITILEDAKEHLEDFVCNDELQVRRNKEVIHSINEALKNPLQSIEEHFKAEGRMVIDYITKDDIKGAIENMDNPLPEEEKEQAMIDVFDNLHEEYNFDGEGASLAIEHAIEYLYE